jgi:predicted TPR repeat methyltransferase
MAAACGAGLSPDRASDDYVRQVFDTFAEAFDTKMESLHYQAPGLITDVVAARYTPRADLDVLDAGCGTGLCGPILAPYARHLVGVDLSAGMVEKARARDVYHDLIVAELTAFLADGPPARYDLIISADTVVYFGALEHLLAAAARALRPGGHLVFTVESWDGEDAAASATDDDAPGFVLNPHGRYAHRESYVRRCAERIAGLADVEIVRQTLRLEMGQPVHGFVVAARKPGAAAEK